jgi:hypothetical protein
MKNENNQPNEKPALSVGAVSGSNKLEVKYILTFWQKIQLIPLKLIWFFYDPQERKNWHEVKKAMEKHEHKFTKLVKYREYNFLKCEHEGCTLCNPID